jgi:hypothetical protein
MYYVVMVVILGYLSYLYLRVCDVSIYCVECDVSRVRTVKFLYGLGGVVEGWW